MSIQVNLQRWRPHLVAARREGKTLSEYARSHGLSKHTLYAARQMLGSVDGKPGAQRRQRMAGRTKKLAPPAFASVKLAGLEAASSGPAARLRAQLPNGVSLELIWNGSEAGLLAAAIQALAGRR
jgi:transposase-like protein